METLLSFITDPIKQLITECVVQPLKRHISYPFTYKTNIQKLSSQVEKLKAQRDDLQLSINHATARGDEIKPSVQAWLIVANEAIDKSENVIRQEDQAGQKCYNFQIPNLKKRYQLSCKAEEEVLVIQDLQKDAITTITGEISYRPQLNPIIAPSVYGDEKLGSRLSILEEVMAALLDPNITAVGVFGMGGVGKTTLAEHVRRQAIEACSFDLVFMTEVSPEPDLDNIRQEIADMLALEFQEKSPAGKANRLHQTLLAKKSMLLIMDNIWGELPLQKIGIPSGDYHKGCKLLLTSRSRDVLSIMNNTQRNIPIDLLSDIEAWSLFTRTVDKIQIDEFVAFEVARKCVWSTTSYCYGCKGFKR